MTGVPGTEDTRLLSSVLTNWRINMTNIEQKFSDITNVFASDGYTFLKVRSALENFQEQAELGDKDAEGIVEVFNRFHRLCVILSK